MKKVFQKNQMIIMTLAVVIAVAGYVNYSQKYDILSHQQLQLHLLMQKCWHI